MVVHAGEGVFYHLLALSSTEQDANGRIVAGAHLVLAVMRNVCVELSEVLMRELLVLQLYDDTAMQNAVVEHKVGIIVLVVNDNALLAGLEAEALAEFEDELLQVSYKCILQVMLIHDILCFQSKKFKSERLTNLQLCGIVALYRRERKQLFGIAADTCPYI